MLPRDATDSYIMLYTPPKLWICFAKFPDLLCSIPSEQRVCLDVVHAHTAGSGTLPRNRLVRFKSLFHARRNQKLASKRRSRIDFYVKHSSTLTEQELEKPSMYEGLEKDGSFHSRQLRDQAARHKEDWSDVPIHAASRCMACYAPARGPLDSCH